MTRVATIEKNVIIRKTRRLPTVGDVLVKVGESVGVDDVIARGKVRNPELVEVRVDQRLGVDLDDLSGYMLKAEEDAVKKDEIIAIRRSFFGKSTRVCRSPIDGTVEVFSKSTGKVLIRGEPLTVEIKAHIPGKIVALLQGEGAILECNGSIARGAIGFGGETHGFIENLVEDSDEALTDSLIDKSHAGKVIIGGAIATLEAMRKAALVGAAAVVVGGVDVKDLTELLGYELGFGVTGNEMIGLTLIVTEGFGSNPMNSETFQLFKGQMGRLACVDGTTQIRTRMLRPEVIVPTTHA
jgi:hypothetical protein